MTKSKEYLCFVCNKPIEYQYATHGECSPSGVQFPSPKTQKYQCWKCEGEKVIPSDWYIGNDGCTARMDTDCSNCKGKGYIELIPYKS